MFFVLPSATTTGVAGAISANAGALGGSGGSITISTKGPVNVGLGDLSFAPLVQGNGGNLSIQASNLNSFSSSLNASGVGSGDGGAININLNNSGSFFSISAVTANSGASGGAGGTINISAGVVSGLTTVSANAVNGHGGTVILNSLSSNLSLPGTVISVDAASLAPGRNFDGGTISLSAFQLIQSAVGGYLLSANGVGSGNGGSIKVNDVLSNLNINNQANAFVVSAQGANGGTVNLSAGHALNLNTQALNFSPTASNGNGGSLTLNASGLDVQGDLNASGLGTGNGGAVTISSTFPLTIGTASPANGVSGAIHANSGILAVQAGVSASLMVTGLALIL